jgi:hypothetical protein
MIMKSRPPHDPVHASKYAHSPHTFLNV